LSAGEMPLKKISTSKVCLLCKEKVSSEEKIKVFGKSICLFAMGVILLLAVAASLQENFEQSRDNRKQIQTKFH